MKLSGLLMILVTLSLCLHSCGEEETPDDGNGNNNDPCENTAELSIDELIHSFEDQSTGRVEIGFSGGNGGLEFTLDGTTSNTTGVFADLPAGNYTVTATDESDCISSIDFEILEFPEVSFADEVFPIIQANCAVSGCHVAGNGIPVWDDYTTIAENADRIYFRVEGKTMPPETSGNSLTEDEIETILNWIDVGAPNN